VVHVLYPGTEVVTLRPFFTYFGGKYRMAAKMPPPAHGRIVEAFAGSAGYAMRHPALDVLLVEKNPTIAGIWRYLIETPAAEIRALPDLPEGATVDDLEVTQPARDLIGMRLNGATAAPRKSASAWMRGGTKPRQFWGSFVREMIASQVEQIRHWQVLEGDYSAAPDVRATWIIDPPYEAAGHHYPCGSKAIDFVHLAQWSRSREGLVFVHEAQGATWLPFLPYADVKATTHGGGAGRTSSEVLYAQYDGDPIIFEGP
jgi:hypothetical protein